MTLELEHILERIDRKEKEKSDYILLAEKWEKMWSLDPGYGRTVDEAVKAGQEQVILPTPFNIVNLAQRLLSTDPKIDVMPRTVGEREAEDDAEQVEKWLQAMWWRINRQQKRNVIADAIWYVLVRGRFALEIKWIEEALPKRLQKDGFPISVRCLDPVSVGVHQGPLYTEYAYHKYVETLLDVLQRYPDLKKNTIKDGVLGTMLQDMEKSDDGDHEATEVEVWDFWWIDTKTGDVWNAVGVEDEFAIEPHKTEYPDIPIVVGRGDYSPAMGDEYDGLSILHPMSGLWQYQCRLASQMGTGLLWHFWPAILVTNEHGESVPDLQIGPGMTTPAPAGTKVDLITIDPNVPLAQAVYGQVDQAVQQSGFPEVMYGQAPGDLQAGYGVSLLSDAAKGRIKNFAEALEQVFTQVHEQVLSQIETFRPEGVSLWMVDDQDNTKESLTVTGEMLQGYYENRVRMTPQVPENFAQKSSLGLQLANNKYISAETLRDKFLDITVPSDETKRIANEELYQSDELRSLRLRRAAQTYEPDKWKELLKDTPFMPPEEGQHQMPDGTMMPDAEMQGGPPPGMPPGPPGGMPPGGPPMGGPPPGMPPGPPPGLPPEGPPPLQPEAQLTGPMGGGIPPEIQGQFTPEDLEMLRQQDPALFAQVMGNPLPPQEELDLMAGV